MDFNVSTSFAELARKYDDLPMFPVFDIAHYILMVLQLRNDAGVGKPFTTHCILIVS